MIVVMFFNELNCTPVLHNIGNMRNSAVPVGTDQPGDGDDGDESEDSDSDGGNPPPRLTREAKRQAGKDRRDNVVKAFFRCPDP